MKQFAFLLGAWLIFSSVVMAAQMEHPPQVVAADETVFDADAAANREFVEAEGVLSEAFSSCNYAVTHRTFSRSPGWGYILRAVVVIYGDDGKPFPPTYFMRWWKANEQDGVFVAPAEEPL